MKTKSTWILLIAIFLFIIMLLLFQFNYVEVIDIYSKNIQTFFIHPSFRTIFLLITNLMSLVGVIIILIITIYFLRKKNARKDIMIYIGTILVCLAFTNLIKVIIRRTRPINTLIEVSGFSFPSSHASIAMVVYGYLILLIRKYYQGKRKNLYIVLCICMILLTGISRIYFNVHYITDVIAGFSLGLILLVISNFIMKRLVK